METRLLRRFQPFYARHKEALMYLLFGGLTTVINFACFAALTRLLRMEPLAANIIAFVVGVVFAYVTNRIWVFASRARGMGAILRELAAFLTGRVATLGMEELLLWVGIDKLGLDSLVVKTVAVILVILANYVISKWLVFRKPDQTE